ncbi:MAG: GC-type dockerin domain-anchored protein, partial [Phycisphaerales bacterium]
DTPLLDLTTLVDPRVSYARWHVSNGNDPFRFQISNNGGGTFTTVETVNDSSGWNTVEFRLSDYVTVTDQMVLRFTVQDTPNDSVTESGVDAFRVFDIVCGSDCPADMDGSGALDFFDVSAFLNAFDSQDPAADFNGDGNYDFFDLSSFLNAFDAGCP